MSRIVGIVGIVIPPFRRRRSHIVDVVQVHVAPGHVALGPAPLAVFGLAAGVAGTTDFRIQRLVDLGIVGLVGAEPDRGHDTIRR